MSVIDDALDYCLDTHTLLRSGSDNNSRSASLSLSKLLIDCLSRQSENRSISVDIDYHDAYLAMCAIFVALDKIKDCDHVCIDSLRHTMAAFLDKVDMDD